MIIREEDCGTEDHVELPAIRDGQVNLSAAGRVLASDVHKPLKDGKPGKTVLGEKGELITKPRLREIVEQLEEQADEFLAPGPLGAQVRSEVGVCRACYGRSWRRATCARSATRSASSPRSRSASRARS